VVTKLYLLKTCTPRLLDIVRNPDKNFSYFINTYYTIYIPVSSYYTKFIRARKSYNVITKDETYSIGTLDYINNDPKTCTISASRSEYAALSYGRYTVKSYSLRLTFRDLNQQTKKFWLTYYENIQGANPITLLKVRIPRELKSSFDPKFILNYLDAEIIDDVSENSDYRVVNIFKKQITLFNHKGVFNDAWRRERIIN